LGSSGHRHQCRRASRSACERRPWLDQVRWIAQAEADAPLFFSFPVPSSSGHRHQCRRASRSACERRPWLDQVRWIAQAEADAPLFFSFPVPIDLIGFRSLNSHEHQPAPRSAWADCWQVQIQIIISSSRKRSDIELNDWRVVPQHHRPELLRCCRMAAAGRCAVGSDVTCGMRVCCDPVNVPRTETMPLGARPCRSRLW